MARVPIEALDRVGRLAEPALHDRFSEAGLRRALEEYLPRRREPIGPVTLHIDGAEVPSIFPALADRSVPFERLEVTLGGGPIGAEAWEYLRPFHRLRIGPAGPAEFHATPDGPPRSVQVRLLLREQYRPMAHPTDGPAERIPTGGRPELFTPATLAAYIRGTGTVPFALALAVYFTDARVRYEIDLIESVLLMDGRAHRLPVMAHRPRTARISHGVDLIVARGDLSLPSARALEAVVESDGVTALDLAPLFGGVRELGSSALDTLLARRLVTLDRRTGVYRARLEALAPSPDRSRARPDPLRSNPRLRTSVMELLAAADARATCPLCGAVLPAGPRRLLCDACQTLMEGSEGGGSSPS